MDKRYIYYCLILAVLVTGLFNIFMPKSAYISDQHLKVGQIAEKDIIAPFDFPIMKSKKQLDIEREAVIKSLKPVYALSDEVQFNTIKLLNDLFLPLIESKDRIDTTEVKLLFKQNGVNISAKNVRLLQNKNTDKIVYTLLQNELSAIYKTGVYDVINRDTINVVIDGEINLTPLSKLILQNEAIESILAKAANANIKSILAEILPSLVKPNLIIDQKKFNALVEQTVALIPKTTGTVTKNEILVRSNSRISEDDLNKIQSLITATQEREIQVNTFKSLAVNFSFFLYFFILGLMLYAFFKLFYNKLLVKQHHFSPLIIGLAINAMLAIMNNQILGLQTLLIPYSLTIISAAILIDIPFAMFYNFLSFASIYPFVNWETFSPLVLVLATSGVLLLMGRLNDKHQYFSIWLYLLITTTVLTMVFAMFKHDSMIVFLGNIGYAFISSTLSVILMIFTVPFIEKKWNLATKQELLELLDFNHPLLKKLATEAVGTYYHSLIVGNLAERAAESIGANSLLTRVSSYYHDIGKIVHPEFFTENNPESALIHDNLAPSESAEAIKKHVGEGIKLAVKYRLPPVVIDIILQHHGTGYMRYFLDKAEKSRNMIDLDLYRYNGPKPQTKEAVLVMIADVVESTAKSWDEISPEDIKKILNDTVLRLIKEGQLEESPITMSDLSKAKESMIPILESIYRKRQQYPENEDTNE